MLIQSLEQKTKLALATVILTLAACTAICIFTVYQSSKLVSQRLDAFCYLGIFLCLGAFEYLHGFNLLVVQIFVFEGSPVGDEQSVGIVLRPWHVLNLAHGDDGAF